MRTLDALCFHALLEDWTDLDNLADFVGWDSVEMPNRIEESFRRVSMRSRARSSATSG